MKMDEMARMAVDNLRKSRLRTFLTTLGVVIGIGALVSMVSFGTGMQKNVTNTFLENDLFTSLQVLPAKADAERMRGQGHMSAGRPVTRPDSIALDAAAVEKIRSMPGVTVAFPEVRFPVKVSIDGREATTNARAMPAVMGGFKPFDKLQAGTFFGSDTARAVILSPRLLRDMKFVLIEPGRPRKLTVEDTLKGFRSVRPAELIGTPVDIVTSSVDFGKLMRNPMAALSGGADLPFAERTTRLRIAGVAKQSDGFGQGLFESGVILPMETAESLPRLGFSSVWDLLGRTGGAESYGSVYVRVKRMEDLAPLKKSLEREGFGVVSIADQLEDFKKGFLVFDAVLGAVGTIALIVAALGIINTMVMSILERRREIGIMKAVGASEWDIKGIFFVEAGVIGFAGGVFGLLLGWAVTRVANGIANIYIAREGGSHAELFFISPWLIFGALLFSVTVSLAAGLYPAMRAASVNPVEALRHD
ncbi:MAG: ABC transporter permease [bacterium]|nr:ABC transporter permease [bacterium]